MSGLARDAMTYIRFFVFLTPIMIPTMAIFNSAFYGNPNGLLYVFGLSVAKTFGALLANGAKSLVPHSGTSNIEANDFSPLADPACNLIQATSFSDGWGTIYSMPGPHALLLSFTTTYLLFPMFINDNVNYFLIGGLTFLMTLSAWMRTTAPMNCISPTDVIAGWGTGFVLGTLWYFAVAAMNPHFTYFSNMKSDKQECKLDKKAFRCKSKKKAT